jgi:AcrR family transcriptional regulator
MVEGGSLRTSRRCISVLHTQCTVYVVHSFNPVNTPVQKSSRAMPGPRKSPSKKGPNRPRTAAGSTTEHRVTHRDVMQASLAVDPDLRRRSELLWEDRSRPTRGPKAAFTPDDVVQAAMALADVEGLSAVTMNAVAAQLGLTTMAVYRYFPSKETLIDAIIDAGMGLPPSASRTEGTWREEVTRWAHAKRDMLIARPWLAELPFVAAPHGPNWLLWLEALAKQFARTGLRGRCVGEMISIVDGFTRGASDTSISLARWKARGKTEQEWVAAVGADLGRAVGDERFPAFAAVITAPTEEGGSLSDSFDFCLQRVLDGIERYVMA